jgi:glycosyltransferase involved in cell wall biosynthesis
MSCLGSSKNVLSFLSNYRSNFVMIKKPKILIIIPHYLPGYRAGGPVRTISNMVYWLGDEFNFHILTSHHDLGSPNSYPNIEAGVWYPVGKAHVRYLQAHEMRLQSFSRILSQLNYDLIYLDGTFSHTSLKLLALRKFSYLPAVPIVMAPRGHLLKSALNIKNLKKRFFLKTASISGLYDGLIWHASTEIEKASILEELQLKNPNSVQIVSNLPAPVINHSAPLVKEVNQAKMIFLSRIVPVKNLLFAIETLRAVEGEIDFGIYGPVEDLDYWQACQLAIAKLPKNIRITYHGELPFDKVSEVFSANHLLFLPTLGENYGHVIFEALGAACPVLISNQTPWNNVLEAGAGWTEPLNQSLNFRQRIQKLVNMNQEEFNRFSKAARNYAENYVRNSQVVERMKDSFRSILES